LQRLDHCQPPGTQNQQWRWHINTKQTPGIRRAKLRDDRRRDIHHDACLIAAGDFLSTGAQDQTLQGVQRDPKT
jgi:hypothetical protein